MIVHLYSDASVAKGLAAWAMLIHWPDASRPNVEGGGLLKKSTKSSVLAELQGMGNALHKAVRHKHVAPGDHVTIYCDCQAALDWLGEKCRVGTTARRIELYMSAKLIRQIAIEAQITIDAQWIKGHMPKGSSAHYDHNRACDSACRKIIKRLGSAKPKPKTPPTPEQLLARIFDKAAAIESQRAYQEQKVAHHIELAKRRATRARRAHQRGMTA